MKAVGTAVALLAFLLGAAPTPASALDGFERCIGPELMPRARIRSLTVLCQQSSADIDTCASNAVARLPEVIQRIEIGCSTDQLEACVLSKEPVPCLHRFRHRLDALRSEVFARVDDDRVEAAAAAEGGLAGPRLLRDWAAFQSDDPEVECWRVLVAMAQEFDLPKAALCEAFSASMAWYAATEWERRLIRAESGR